MKVWIVEIAEPLPVVDGSFRDLRCGILSKALLSRGHQVLWWTSTFDHMRKRHRFVEPQSVQVQPGFQLRLLHGPAYQTNISLNRIRHNWAVAGAFQREASRWSDQPDILFVCVPTLELAERAIMYGKPRQIPVVLDVRDRWPDLYLTPFPRRLRGLARLAFASEFQRAARMFRSATGLTAVSNSYLEWALGYAKRRQQAADGVFALGYSPPTATPAEVKTRAEQLRVEHRIRPGALVVAFLGTFGASYDLETVIRTAWTLEANGLFDVQIVLAGDGDAGLKLRDMARGLGNTIFTGWLDQMSMLALLSISSIGLTAYRDEALQSLPNKPFEYMAAGLPLLSSLRGELETLIRDEQIGLQYEAGNPNSLLERIAWLAANPDIRLAMGQRALQLFKQRYSADLIYPRLVSHLEGIVKHE